MTSEHPGCATNTPKGNPASVGLIISPERNSTRGLIKHLSSGSVLRSNVRQVPEQFGLEQRTSSRSVADTSDLKPVLAEVVFTGKDANAEGCTFAMGSIVNAVGIVASM